MLRRDLRGSGAAIIALLGESEHEAHASFHGSGRSGWIEHSSEIVYFVVGTDRYFLCKRDLERLHALGYVYRNEHQYRLARLGRLLLERFDNARLLAKGVARAKRGSHLRCNGRLWLRCRCEKYWLTGRRKARVPFPIGKWWTSRTTVDAAVVAVRPPDRPRPSPAVRAIFQTETLPNLRLHPRRSVPGSCGTVPPQPTSTKTTKTTAPATYPNPLEDHPKNRNALRSRRPAGYRMVHPAAAGRFETTSRRKRRPGLNDFEDKAREYEPYPVTRLPSTLRAP